MLECLREQRGAFHWSRSAGGGLAPFEMGTEEDAELSLYDFAAFLHENPGARRVWQAREEELNNNRRILRAEGAISWSFWQEDISEVLTRLDAMSQ